jgi:hypothetical protein
MLSVVSSLLASLSLALKQPLAGYCDVRRRMATRL